jgi:hypothetical protein
VGWATGISGICVIPLKCTYMEDWGHYMVGLTCCVLGEFLSFQCISHLKAAVNENECILKLSAYYYKFQECAGKLLATRSPYQSRAENMCQYARRSNFYMCIIKLIHMYFTQNFRCRGSATRAALCQGVVLRHVASRCIIFCPLSVTDADGAVSRPPI